MNVTAEKNEKVAQMIFASIYPHYVAKVEKKGRTKEELHTVLTWLTGFDDTQLQQLIADKVTLQTFFDKATLHPNAHLIKGVICGYRIEDITFELYRNTRYMDKLVDELAKGKAMEKILR
ncbi:DUF2200 domain-containing protein [Zhouia sp. PK063]|uniref:DUF2200 domain-containing protein n=1 Tax=Zhouia sp. PK063 TaxID=3373602 RepID=UPI0037A05546